MPTESKFHSTSKRKPTPADNIHRELELAEQDGNLEEGEIQEKKEKHLKHVKKITGIAFIAALLAITSTIMEAFAGLTLQYCHNLGLMNSYWGFWNLIQIGSCIAMVGITAKGCYSLNDRDHLHPPWSIALGTHVLVLAGLGLMIGEAVRRAWNKFREVVPDPPEDTLSMSRRM